MSNQGCVLTQGKAGVPRDFRQNSGKSEQAVSRLMKNAIHPCQRLQK